MRDRAIGKRYGAGRLIAIGLLLLIAGCAGPNGSGNSGNSGNDRNSSFYGGIIGGGVGLP
jgi:hypothetical protein